MSAAVGSLALLYAPAAYSEPPVRLRRSGNSGPTGRLVVGARFLDAYLHHGAATRLVAVAATREAAEAFLATCKAHPTAATRPRRCEAVAEGAFHRAFYPDPPARVVHAAGLPPAGHAWARQTHGPHAFALSGVVHSLCAPATLSQLALALAAPLLPYDTLICSSEASRRALVALVEGLGGSLRPRLAVIPWGVDTERFRPPTAEERAAARAAVRAAPDEIVVACVGRLSFHGRANPYPLYHGLYHAARATQKKVRLVLAGWAVNDAIEQAFLDSGRVLAATVPTTHLRGTGDEVLRCLHAADVFATFPDSLQEGHAQVLLEAMACGLPVVASDWAGYREVAVPDETALLVPTTLLAGTAPEATTRLLQGELNEDGFLAATGQTVVVDPRAAVAAFTALFQNAERARTLGAAGRRRVEAAFTWRHCVAAHDRVWAEQEQVRAEHAARAETAGVGVPGPAQIFAAFAGRVAGDADLVVAVPDNETLLHRLSKLATTAFAPEGRSTDLIVLRRVLDRAARPVSLGELEQLLREAGVGRPAGRNTLAWMLKYGLLAFAPA